MRFFLGLEGASTRSTTYDSTYETSGWAAGSFGGTEIYLMKRLSIGLDAGPYYLASEVHGSDVKNGEVTIVINSFMNFYFL